MKALYVDWYAPKKAGGLAFPIKKPWEIAMIIRSTFYSKKANGLSPTLYCDPETFSFYEKIGLLDCFDEIRPILPLHTSFNPTIFWAAGKFYAIKDTRENFLMIDLDAELRFKCDFEEYDVFCTHSEGISKKDLNYYPDPLYLDTKNYFGKKFGISWSNKAFNTCLLYFKDLELAHEYAESALDFITSLETTNPAFEYVAYILLAEQRFLYEYCQIKKLKVGTLIEGRYHPSSLETGQDFFENSNYERVGNKGFLHVWGFKNRFYQSKEEQDSFFGTLLASNLELREKIIDSVTKSLNIIPKLV